MISRPHDGNPMDTVCKWSIADSLNRCFLGAYLLIGNSAWAENAVMNAIDLWDPDEDDENKLFQLTLKTAVGAQVTTSAVQSNRECSAHLFLPIELRRVFELEPDLRLSFVLRMLARLPSRACAEMLDSDVSQINQRCCDAVKHLATLTYSTDRREETCRINTRFL